MAGAPRREARGRSVKSRCYRVTHLPLAKFRLQFVRYGYIIGGMSTVSTKIDPKMAGKEYFTTAEAAEILDLNRDTVRHYCQGEDPRIKAVKVGRDWLIPRAEIDRYERDRRDVGRPPSDC